MFSVPFLEYIAQLMQPRPLITLASLLALGLILIYISKSTTFNTRILAYGALSIAAAFTLSYVRIVRLPNAGTITLASMLPIFIFAYIAGPRAGVAAGLAYGLLQYLQDPFWVHWAQFLLDYPIAFALLGLSGYFRNNIFLGSVVGSAARLVCHFLSGVVFFASYAGDQNVYIYSLLYNISYMLPDTLICLAVLLVPNLRAVINRIAGLNLQYRAR